MSIPNFLISQTYVHMTTWFILIFLYVFVLIMHKDTKGRKIVHLIIWIMYICVTITGFALYYLMINSDLLVGYTVKVISGIAFIVFAEMTIIRANKKKKFQIPLVISFALIIFMMFMGYYLPMGMDMFH